MSSSSENILQPISLSQEVTNEWKSQIYDNLSLDSKKAIDSLEQLFEYNFNTSISVKEDVFLHILKLQDTHIGSNSFVAFTEEGNLYQTLGILKVSGENPLEQLETIQLLATKLLLPDNQFVEIYDLQNRVLTKYEGTVGGKVRLSKSIAQNKQKNISSSSKVAPEGQGETCFDYYWVTYDGITGKKISEQYMYTECRTGQGGGGYAGTGILPVNANNVNMEALSKICESSFIFQTFINTSNGLGGWQVAGTKNIHMNIVDFETKKVKLLSLPTIYFGLPVTRANGDFILLRQQPA